MHAWSLGCSNRPPNSNHLVLLLILDRNRGFNGENRVNFWAKEGVGVYSELGSSSMAFWPGFRERKRRPRGPGNGEKC